MEFKKRKRTRDTHSKPLSTGTAHENTAIPEIYGFYYDKEKRRYFPVDNNNQSKTQTFVSFLNKKNNLSTLQKNDFSQPSSTFQTLLRCKNLKKSEIQAAILKDTCIAKDYALESFGEKTNNLPYKIYREKFFVFLSNTTSVSSLTVLKSDNTQYIKKIFFPFTNERYKLVNFTLTDAGKVVLITKNFSFFSMVFDEVLETNVNSIVLNFTTLFSFKANFGRIPMIYDFPIIKEDTGEFFCLIWNKFYKLSPGNFSINIKNNDSVILNFEEFPTKPSKIHFQKVLKSNYTNFFVTKKYILLYASDGKIHKYNHSLKLYQIIENDTITSVIESIKVSESNLILLSSNSDLFSYNFDTNEVFLIYKSAHDSNLKFKLDSLAYEPPFVFFVNEKNEVVILSLLSYEIKNAFPVKREEYCCVLSKSKKRYVLAV